ncbi:hypothetical protein ACU635_16915 [[Actinomadura] parvosata]|uniref:hypothetical protein n=1 Tax=[Actinomadura] parvosata TaxID=1955412 RepID=UPI00406C125E
MAGSTTNRQGQEKATVTLFPRSGRNEAFEARLRWSALHSVRRDSWGPERTSGAVPAPGKGGQGRMTAGDRLDAHTTGGASIVHDPVTLKRPGLVLAAGPWLLWEEGGAYRPARVG